MKSLKTQILILRWISYVFVAIGSTALILLFSSCRATRDIQRTETDSTSYYREKVNQYKDSLAWSDSVTSQMVQSWLDMGVLFADEPCPPSASEPDTTTPYMPGLLPADGRGVVWPRTVIETKPDGSTVFQTNQKLKALNLNFRTLSSRYDSVSKASQMKDSVIKELEQKVEMVKKEKTVHVEREWYIPWWIWLIVAGLAVLWIRKQFF